jgi:cytoskeletal protein CcmA (bactofilin family)
MTAGKLSIKTSIISKVSVVTILAFLLIGLLSFGAGAQSDIIISDTPEKCDYSSQSVLIQSSANLENCDTIKGSSITVEQGTDLGSTGLSSSNDIHIKSEVQTEGDITSGSGDILLESGVSVNGDLSAAKGIEAGENSDLEGDVDASQNIEIDSGSNVEGDMSSGSGDILLESDVSANGDLSAAKGIEAGENSDLGGDVDASQNIEIDSGSNVEGDMSSGSGDILLESDVSANGDLSAAKGIETGVDSTLRGDVSSGSDDIILGSGNLVDGSVDSAKGIEIGSDSTLKGDVSSGSDDILVGPNALVEGDVDSAKKLLLAESAEIEGDASASSGTEILESPSFDLSLIDSDGEVKEGEKVNISYKLENTGDFAGTQNVEFYADGQLIEENEISLEKGEVIEDQFSYQTEKGDAPDISLKIKTEDDQLEATFNVTEDSGGNLAEGPRSFASEYLAMTAESFSSDDDLQVITPNRQIITKSFGYNGELTAVESDQTGEGYFAATESQIISIDYDSFDDSPEKFQESKANYVIDTGLGQIEDLATSTGGEVVVALSTNVIKAYSTESQELLWESSFSTSDRPVNVVSTSKNVYAMTSSGEVQKINVLSGEVVESNNLPTDGDVIAFDLSEKSEKMAYIDSSKSPKVATFDQFSQGQATGLSDIETGGFFFTGADIGDVTVGPEGYVGATIFDKFGGFFGSEEGGQGYAVYDDDGSQLYNFEGYHQTFENREDDYLRDHIEISRKGDYVFLGGNIGTGNGVYERLDKESGSSDYRVTVYKRITDLAVIPQGPEIE